MGHFGTAHKWLGGGGGEHGGKKPQLPKICNIYPTAMKLTTVISYLKKIQKLYK